MVVQDPLLCDLPIQVTLEEVNSQIALEYGQAMTVRVCKMDGELMVAESCSPNRHGRGHGSRQTAGRQTWSWSSNSRVYILIHRHGTEGELIAVVWASETSKLTPSDTPPPTRSHLP
ncbi:U11/U12 small nuclear ribonucleoprotein 25 kDa protein isoform X1 [Rattus norvegicus]|uniref:U11/U12 small nuclear ribonucleoprotein 25 kDa protein isoform X1 n=1 Tax=Rattus norvegicus TaxID=10116 RepID=UPI0004E474CA|nr:U11/U12 small nuclear ribonucleoprotein 25 kDa protein isoform X1 [Rattus norvegicus]|eukprot:XP_008765842.1 PREDICTED: U11/U12 small nuclear ribonucleoprotein 25 kDa protein isoform X1 [Rattus norvegicus]